MTLHAMNSYSIPAFFSLRTGWYAVMVLSISMICYYGVWGLFSFSDLITRKDLFPLYVFFTSQTNLVQMALASLALVMSLRTLKLNGMLSKRRVAVSVGAGIMCLMLMQGFIPFSLVP